MEVRFRAMGGETSTMGVERGRWTEPDGSETVDLTGLWAVGGLADAHVHLSADRLELGPAVTEDVEARAFAALAGGVFLCLDKGWSDDVVLRLARTPGFPEVRAAGRMFASPGGYYPGFAVEVEPEVLAARVAAVVRGRPWLKLVGDWPRKGEGVRPNFDEAALHAAVGVAHAAGCKVAIHTMAPDVPGMAVRAGVDSIEHGLFLSEADLAGLGSRGGTWVPTVRRTRQLLEAMSPGSSGARILGEGLVNTSRMLGAAAELGVVVLAGSDLAMASSRIGEEVLGLMELGCAAEPAVASALASTIDGTGEHASAGAPADLVAFENHPWEDPSTMLDPVFVMRMGRVLFDRRS